MAAKLHKREGYLISQTGGLIDNIRSDNDKCYAVIVECGHCGNGFYIPIMFTERCKDIKSAIEAVKTKPMVKRDRKDCVLEAFEITLFEKFFIESINNHDPYLKGCLKKDSDEINERRVMSEELANTMQESEYGYCNLKTADEYNKNYVLESYFAPYFLGSDLIFPKKANKKQLLHDFFQRATIRYGLLKESPFFMTLYYQLYGKDNDLKIVKDGNCFYYKKFGENIVCEIPDSLIEFVESNEQTQEEPEREEFFSGVQLQRKSQTERFNERFKKYQELNNLNQEEPERE